MPVQVILPEAVTPVEPGGRATCRATVRNTGPVDDRITVEMVGGPASWATVHPPVLPLAADASAEVLIQFHPPRASHVRAGRIPFGVLATSVTDSHSTMAEQVVELSRFTDTGIELIARRVRRRSARYWLEVSNRGNGTVRLSLAGRDLDQVLRVDCDPDQLTVFPGSTEYTRVRVRMPCPVRIDRTPLSFQVIVTSDVDDPVIVAGTVSRVR